jgi:hypothetical protein
MRTVWLAFAAALAAAGALAAVAVTSAAGAPASASVQVHFQIEKFVKQGTGLVAHGAAVATYSDSSGQTKTTSAPLTAHVITKLKLRGLSSASETCQVLYLRLDKLSLALLGLHVDLDKVILTVTANSNGGALGSLFCELVHTKVKLLSTTAKRLTQSARTSGLATTGLGFSVPLRTGATAPTGTCPVLDLVLGPLNLQLLGLNATLNQVHLSITADPSGGVLGSLFCQLATATATLPAVP